MQVPGRVEVDLSAHIRVGGRFAGEPSALPAAEATNGMKSTSSFSETHSVCFHLFPRGRSPNIP